MGAQEIAMVAIVLGLSLCSVVFWVWMLIDCIKNESDEGNDKMTWVIIICVTGVLGGLLYLLVRRPKRLVSLGR